MDVQTRTGGAANGAGGRGGGKATQEEYIEIKEIDLAKCVHRLRKRGGKGGRGFVNLRGDVFEIGIYLRTTTPGMKPPQLSPMTHAWRQR
jgi:hypothetical protein